MQTRPIDSSQKSQLFDDVIPMNIFKKRRPPSTCLGGLLHFWCPLAVFIADVQKYDE